ncbi:Oar protein [Acidisarcina polymorpha]|uniref:Oar protein n=1 Tax=Acidisarcina polymorpha TaxID=2211140 RepID=A0A2Z5FTG6_9BACT|nr:TonB-dependent receptor [Acidisarcina polymorpha]AXC09784.1 Oar protein [Acidisarcina polymorpha]
MSHNDCISNPQRQIPKWPAFRVAFVFLSLFAGLPGMTTALAQYTTARLSGIVADRTNAAVPGATVTVSQVTTGYSQTAKTSATGEYSFPSLPVGSYQLTVEMTGFNEYVQKGIVLEVGQAANQNVTLSVGGVSQQVTVEANASLVTTDDPAVGQVIEQRSIQGLPLNGREAQQLVFLVPGAVDVTSLNCGVGCEGGVLPGEQYAKVNGGGANGVYYLLDGVDYNDLYLNTNLPFPSPDALEEFNVQTGNMSATYGNATGGVVNAVSKSGTDSIHGSAFEYLRNYAMDAKNYFATSPNPLKQNQFGGTIGGPILKRRLFYFGSYQGTRQNTAINGLVAFVPTAAERTGDFSDLLVVSPSNPTPIQLVNPNTGASYNNNQVPLSDLDPTAGYLLQHLPLPNGPGRQLTYNGAPSIQKTDEYLAKVDYNIGKHHLSVHYFQLNYNIPVILPPADNILASNTEFPQSLGLKNISVVDIYTISPTILLNSYFGYTSQTGQTLSPAPFTIQDAGSLIAQPTNFKPTLNVGVAGNFTIGEQPASGTWDRGDQSLREVATYIKGAHQIQFGGEIMRVTAPMGNSYQADGVFTFSNSLTGDNVADFELGAVSSFTQAGGLYLNFTGFNWSAFVQDNWKATPRLTLSAGLRWDPFIPYKDSQGRVGCFVPGAQSLRYPNAPAGLIFGGSNHDPGCPSSSIYSTFSEFGPRLGFAYQLTSDGKTSVRGGAGYYYQPPNLVAFEDVVGIPPFAPIVNLSAVNFTDPYGSGGIANPFPAQFGPNTPGAAATFPQDISFTQIFDRHFRPPQILMWNMTLEHGFGANWLVRAAYLGNKGTHLGGTGDQEAGLLAVNPAVYIPGQSTEDNTQQRRIYPSFGFVDSINSGVISNYNSLQLSLEKRLTHGLSFLTNFTWSRSLNNFGPYGQPGALNTNSCSCGRYFDYGPDGGDVNKVFRISGVYAFPNARFKGVLDKVVNGWNLTAIMNWQTGFPFTVFSDFDNSFSGMGADRADLTAPSIKNVVLSNGRSHANLVNEWFNTSDFAPNQVGTFGNTGKNALRGPRFANTDLALLKDAKINERVGLEFRAEFYNVFNNVNFGAPDAGLTDSGFGQITSAFDPRILQMALRLSF